MIVPSFTFFATASAVWRLGAKPVFADIEPETFNLDPADVLVQDHARTPRRSFRCTCSASAPRWTRFGRSPSAARGIPIIEDACQAIGAEYHGARAGSLGTCGCFSFYPTKNLGGFGDGGLITTNDGELAAKLRVLRDHGQQPRYYHHFVGLNSRLDTLQAAVLEREAAEARRLGGRARAARGTATRPNSPSAASATQIVAPTVADGCRHVWNQYTVRVTDGRRDALQKHLADRKIGSAIYYPVPLHLQKCFASLGYREGQLAGDRAGLPRGAVAAGVSGADGGGAGHGDRRGRRLLPGEGRAAA